MADHSTLNPSHLKPGLTTPDGQNLKPGLVTPAYGGGTPSAAGQIKPSWLDSAGKLKPGLVDAAGNLKPSLLGVGNNANAGLLAFNPWELWDAAQGVVYRSAPDDSCPATWAGDVLGKVLTHNDENATNGVSIRDPSSDFGGEPAMSFFQNVCGARERFDAADAADWKFLHDGSTSWTIAVPLFIEASSASGNFFDTSDDGGGPGLRWLWRTDERFDIYVYNDASHRGRLLGTVGDVTHSNRHLCLLSYDSVADELVLRINGTETSQAQAGAFSALDPAIPLRISEDNPTPKIEFPLVFVSKQVYGASQLADLEAYLNDNYG